MDQISEFMKEQGGVASVNELAELLEVPESSVRRWARENRQKRVGSTFVFDKKAALACADDLLGGDEDEVRDEEDLDDDDGEQDDDEETDEDDDED